MCVVFLQRTYRLLPHPTIRPHGVRCFMSLKAAVDVLLMFVLPCSPSTSLLKIRALVDADPVSWSAPEEALTTGKVFAMLSVLLTVAFEVMLPNAAAIGA